MDQVLYPLVSDYVVQHVPPSTTARVHRRVEVGNLPLFQGILKIEVEEVALPILPRRHSLQGLLLKELELAIRQQPTAEKFFEGIQGLHSTLSNVNQAMDS
jgi:hypothetical protein